MKFYRMAQLMKTKIKLTVTVTTYSTWTDRAQNTTTYSTWTDRAQNTTTYSTWTDRAQNTTSDRIQRRRSNIDKTK